MPSPGPALGSRVGFSLLHPGRAGFAGAVTGLSVKSRDVKAEGWAERQGWRFDAVYWAGPVSSGGRSRVPLLSDGGTCARCADGISLGGHNLTFK